jgi:hypothetical protein
MGTQQRRPAFTEGDDVFIIVYGQQLAVAPQGCAAFVQLVQPIMPFLGEVAILLGMG